MPSGVDPSGKSRNPNKPLPPNPDGGQPDGPIDRPLDCDQRFDLFLTPDSPENAPWAPAIFKTDDYGFTKHDIDWTECSCSKCANCKYKIVNCGMNLAQFILLQKDWIEFKQAQGVTVGGKPINVSTVYGHEQRHVAANIAKARELKNEILAGMKNLSDFDSELECKIAASELSIQMVQKWSEYLKENGGDHHGFGGHPEDGVPMDPIGGLPPSQPNAPNWAK